VEEGALGKVTTGDYYSVIMAKTAGVKEFKAKISQYLRDVEHGETVLVSVHGQVVAKLVPLREEEQLTREQREMQQLLADGVISDPGTQEEGDWPEPRRYVKRGEGRAALDADREERV
jgi:prevent-host-death family protein